MENSIVQWSEGCQLSQNPRDYDRGFRDDVRTVLSLFAELTTINNVNIWSPPTLRRHQPLREYASLVVRRMQTGCLAHGPDILDKEDNWIHNDPLYSDIEFSTKTFCGDLFMTDCEGDVNNPFAVDFPLLYFAWYTDATQGITQCKGWPLVADFQSSNLNESLTRRERVKFSGNAICFRHMLDNWNP